MKGAPRRFAHVVVDEAQDLSPMQLRMLARRARGHSMTVLGDLAQATGPASPHSWEESLAHLGRPANAERAELTMGYRLPGAILDLANRLLPYAAADVTPSRSVRDSGDPPDLHAFARRRARRRGRRARVRTRQGDGDGRSHRRPGTCRRHARRARSAGRGARRTGRGVAGTPARRRPGATRQGSRIRRGDRGRTGRDRRARTPRRAHALRRAHARGAAPRDRPQPPAPGRARRSDSHQRAKRARRRRLPPDGPACAS